MRLLSPALRQTRSKRGSHRRFLWRTGVAAVGPGILYLLTGVRGLVTAGGLAIIILLIHSWWRGRPLARARTLERLHDLTPGEFEVLSQRLFQRMGYDVQRVGGSGDGGIDLAGSSAEGIVLVQCKRYRGAVGAAQMRDFYGALSKAQAAKGYLVTTGAFTGAARRWTEGLPIRLELVDGPALTALVRTHLFPEVVPYLERTRVRLALLLVVAAGTAMAAGIAPGPEAGVLQLFSMFP